MPTLQGDFMKRVLQFGIVLSMVSTFALAGDACLYGSAKWRSGSKIDGSSKISTSWNSKKAFPRNGQYRLCLGSNPKGEITVYLNGSTYAKVYVNGDTRLDIVRD